MLGSDSFDIQRDDTSRVNTSELQSKSRHKSVAKSDDSHTGCLIRCITTIHPHYKLLVTTRKPSSLPVMQTRANPWSQTVLPSPAVARFLSKAQSQTRAETTCRQGSDGIPRDIAERIIVEDVCYCSLPLQVLVRQVETSPGLWRGPLHTEPQQCVKQASLFTKRQFDLARNCPKLNLFGRPW